MLPSSCWRPWKVSWTVPFIVWTAPTHRQQEQTGAENFRGRIDNLVGREPSRGQRGDVAASRDGAGPITTTSVEFSVPLSLSLQLSPRARNLRVCVGRERGVFFLQSIFQQWHQPTFREFAVPRFHKTKKWPYLLSHKGHAQATQGPRRRDRS